MIAHSHNSWSDNIVHNSWQKPLPLVTIKVLAFFFFPTLSICEDSINVDVNMGRAMIGRVKTFSLSSIMALSKDDIKYVITKVYYDTLLGSKGTSTPVTCMSGNIIIRV